MSEEREMKAVVVLAAGGTGGHIFPAQALAEALEKEGYRAVLITDKRTGKYPVSFQKENVFHIVSRSLSGGICAKISAVIKNGYGYVQARKLLKELKPIAVVGFGGYPSFPTMYAAIHIKCRTIVHEQNSVLGRVNRAIGSKVDMIATAFAEVRHIKDSDHAKVHYVGNPIRKEVAALISFPYPDIGENEHFQLLVTGGSQGAKVFGEVIPQAIAMLSPETRKRLRVDQQCREEELPIAKKRYEEAQIDADLAPFFNDVASRLAKAHIVIARAGAGTVTELAIAGKPSILVPLPYAMDNHQHYNAKILSENGAAILMPQKKFTAEEVAKVLEALLSNPNTLMTMSEKARKQAKSDAVESLLKLVIHASSKKESI